MKKQEKDEGSVKKYFTLEEIDDMSLKLLFVYAVMDAIKLSFAGAAKTEMDGESICCLLTEGIERLKAAKTMLDR